jgi:type I restriction-modification system DNA methylase subunit
MSTHLSSAAVDALSSITVTGNRATMPPLDRKTYQEVNKALETLGGKWDRKAKAHLFPGDPREAIERVTVDGEFTDRRNELEFFETPEELAALLVERAEIELSHIVLEPSAGRGAIVRAIYAQHGDDVHIIACELNPEFRDVLMELPSRTKVVLGDFLGLKPSTPPTFDRVVMNPPFSKGKDVDHVLHALAMLAPGGRLVSVMASGVTFRQDKRTAAFRTLVARHGWFEELPAGSFKSAGTMVNTVMVIIDKPE